MKRLLVPTDFSPCANNAINFAVVIAKILPLEITLLHVYEHPGSAYTDYVGLDKEFKTTMMNESLGKLEQLKTSIEETEGITVSVIQYEDNIKDSITKASEETKPDMIIMGTLGNGGIKERLWGSNTAAVIGTSKIPVVVIPLEYNGFVPSKILFATNHFEKAQKILNPLFELAAMLMAQVEIAVFSSESKDDAATVMDHSRKLKEYQLELQGIYKDKNLVAVHLSGEDFEDSAEEYISKNNINMLAMVAYHRNFFDRLFRPSATKRMSYHARIPLLVIPAR